MCCCTLLVRRSTRSDRSKEVVPAVALRLQVFFCEPLIDAHSSGPDGVQHAKAGGFYCGQESLPRSCRVATCPVPVFGRTKVP